MLDDNSPLQEPLILAAIKSASASSDVSLDAKLELTAVNEPLIAVPAELAKEVSPTVPWSGVIVRVCPKTVP